METQEQDYLNKHKLSLKKINVFLFLIVTVCVIWVSFDVYLKKKNPTLNKVASVNKVIDSIDNSAAPIKKKVESVISLQADSQGHFRGKLLINNVSMPFLIDTGATITVIPEKLARVAHLPLGDGVITKTAGGKVVANKTKIKSLQINSIVINNLDAQINKHLDEVLIGMNTLKLFQMTLNEEILTLTVNDNHLADTGVLITQLLVKKTVITKKIICNEKNECIASYSNY